MKVWIVEQGEIYQVTVLSYVVVNGHVHAVLKDAYEVLTRDIGELYLSKKQAKEWTE